MSQNGGMWFEPADLGRYGRPPLTSRDVWRTIGLLSVAIAFAVLSSLCSTG